MASFKVAEVFSSINGEGPRSGQLSLFIRMQGCNLSCSYCDTQWANEADAGGCRMTEGEIVDIVRQSRIRNVTLTGGEPLWQEDITGLLVALAREPGFCVEVETNGSIPLSVFAGIKNPPSFNMDYKLPGSGMEDRMLSENLDILTEKDTVKFVVKDSGDLRRSREIIRAHGLTERCRVFLSPVYGVMNPENIVNFMRDGRMNGVTLQLQIHKVIWGAGTRGV